MSDIPDAVLQALVRGRKDRAWFERTFFQIEHRESGKLIPFRHKPQQVHLDQMIDRFGGGVVLKSRKMGVSAKLVARYLHACLFNEGFGVGIVCHKESSAKVLYRMARTMYMRLPAAMREIWPAEMSEKKGIYFQNPRGSFMRILTASSEDAARSDTLRALIADEFAFWPNPEEAISAIFASMPVGSEKVIVSTANGMNYFYEEWLQQDSRPRAFYPWFMDPDYRVGKRRTTQDPPDTLIKAAHDHKLDRFQSNWYFDTFWDTCKGSVQLLNQEFPITPTVAFVSTGDRYFRDAYADARIIEGYRRYQDPKKWSMYLVGADPASGVPGGDYSCFSVWDMTSEKQVDGRTVKLPKLASRLYERMPTDVFAKRLLAELEEYNRLDSTYVLLVSERSAWGIDVIQRLRDMGWHGFYVDQRAARVGGTHTDAIGAAIHTDAYGGGSRARILRRLREYVDLGYLDPTDPTLKAEMNSFVRVVRGNRERFEHMPGRHDDFVFSVGLAMHGIEQLPQPAQVAFWYKPQTAIEVMEWQEKTGLKYVSNDPRWGSSVESSDPFETPWSIH